MSGVVEERGLVLWVQGKTVTSGKKNTPNSREPVREVLRKEKDRETLSRNH
jgi:hypothetical protein